MNSYIQQLFPFVDMGDFIKNTTEVVDAQSIYCPVEFEISKDMNVVTKSQLRPFNSYRIDPCGMIVVDEQDSILKEIKSGVYGDSIKLNITEMDYTGIASRIEVMDNLASVKINKGYMSQDIMSDIFINSATNGFNITQDMIPDVKILPEKKVSFKEWIESSNNVNESADAYKDLLGDLKNTGTLNTADTKKKDSVYEWLDAYFALPEGESVKARSEVPLLIGPTGVFKSSTIKQLCKKYGYRLVDFRVAFTSRLDYSGLYQMGSVDDQLYSYSCPMEELVTCSDGFREYCKRAYDKVSQILQAGYISNDKTSNGVTTEGSQTPLTDEQREKLETLLARYKEYMKPVCLFTDEITRCKDAGVNGILTEMLNQKRFNNMSMKGCKFVAATNANLLSRTDQRHNDHMDELDEMYDVNDDLDIAFSNRFIPLLVKPEDVQDRWFEWATSKNKVSKDGTDKVSNIHDIVIEYLTTDGADQVYNDAPILDAIEKGLSDNETKSQPFPNYRTWEMVSNYMYTIDEEYNLAVKDAVDKDKNDIQKVYRPQVINGLISNSSGERFIRFLRGKGYINIEESLGKEVPDEYSDFLQTSLDAGVPALMVGPSSIGKTSRVEQYIKRQKDRTGLEPVLINIDLASKDAVDLMGMPAKISLVDYVAGKDLDDLGLGEVKKELADTVKSVQAEDVYGLSDYLTVRSPDLDAKNALIKAKKEGREVIFFFDECFTGDTKIKLLDGRVVSFEELNKMYSKEDEFWVYSLNEEGKLVPGKAHTLGVTRKDAELVKVVLDNGVELRCTPEHPFMMRDGSYCEAKDLKNGMSLKAGYFFTSDKGYEEISVAGGKKQFTHRLISEFEMGESLSGSGLHCHHINHNKRDNRPENLTVITKVEHSSEHADTLYNNFITNLDKREESRLRTITDKVTGERFRLANKARWDETLRDNQRNNCKSQWESGQFDNIDRQAAAKKLNSNLIVNFIHGLMDNDIEVNETNYEDLRMKYTGKGGIKYRSVKASRVEELTLFDNLNDAILSAKESYVPVNHKVVSVSYLNEREDVYDIEVDEYHNFMIYSDVDDSGIFVHNCNRVKSSTVLSSMFEVVSDARYANVDFSDMKDKVKVIAACNMSHSEMNEDSDTDYSEAGSIDPALAARFSVFWKKNYDEKDVNSWIAYMEDQKAKGAIDGTLLEFFKSLPMEECIRIVASVEKRKLAYAEPSTRSMTQLSRDIKSMRGISGSADTKLYYGKLLFDDMTRNQLADIYDNIGDEVDVANKLISLTDEILSGKNTWDASLSGAETIINERVLKAEDLLDNIEACMGDIKSIISGPVTSDKRQELADLESFALILLQKCNDMDDDISQKRRAFFEQYVGEEFTKKFLPFFNETFGSENDLDITVEMLSDKTLVKPFFKKQRAKSAGLTEEQYEDAMITLMKSFLDVHGTSLTPDVYAAFIDGIKNSLASNDGMDRILNNIPDELDPLFEKAEQVGDAWIVDLLLSSRVSLQEIADLRTAMSNVASTSTSTSRATIM